jgi:formyltetrahydrofolate-dependent phosphoribosylglycinamide formyltransferase
VLISGGGTTLVNLQERIKSESLSAVIPLVVASRSCPGVERARDLGLNVELVPRSDSSNDSEYSTVIFQHCRVAQVELVVLAGFLNRLVIPDDYTHRVINIHPSLIPAFCGQGLYGRRVHEAVISRGCKVSGCTVHFCDNDYDHGPIILQRAVPVFDDDDADRLAARVFAVECETLPEAIQLFSENRLSIAGRRVAIRPDPQN